MLAWPDAAAPDARRDAAAGTCSSSASSAMVPKSISGLSEMVRSGMPFSISCSAQKGRAEETCETHSSVVPWPCLRQLCPRACRLHLLTLRMGVCRRLGFWLLRGVGLAPRRTGVAGGRSRLKSSGERRVPQETRRPGLTFSEPGAAAAGGAAAGDRKGEVRYPATWPISDAATLAGEKGLASATVGDATFAWAGAKGDAARGGSQSIFRRGPTGGRQCRTKGTLASHLHGRRLGQLETKLAAAELNDVHVLQRALLQHVLVVDEGAVAGGHVLDPDLEQGGWLC